MGRGGPLPLPRPVHLQGAGRLLHAGRHDGEVLEPEDNPYGPLGAKAVGEPPLMYGIGVFFAIRNAMKAFRPGAGLRLHAPLTPERVLLDLHRE